MKRANTMSTITVELIIKMKTKFTSSNAEKTNGFISPDIGNFHTVRSYTKNRIRWMIITIHLFAAIERV